MKSRMKTSKQHLTHFDLSMQQLELAKNVEEFVFWAGDDDGLHSAKRELIEQMTKFDIAIKAKGFFDLNRQFLASVRSILNK